MTAISITGLGAYLPRRRVANDVGAPLDRAITAQELERLGVRTRYVADDDEGIAEMAAAAATAALRHAGADAAGVDLLILANWTQRRYIPEFGPRLKTMIGADRAFAFDISCACAGFLVGLAAAAAFLSTGHAQAVVVASETTSRRARPGGRSTLVYSDGAGAAVLRPGDGPIRLVDVELATLGEHHAMMDVSPEGYVRSHVPQRALVELAADSLVATAAAVLRRNAMSFDDVDWIVPHSGTAGVQATLRTRLGPAADRVLTNLPSVGNLSSASIPVALDQFIRAGTIRPGHRVLVASVGTGFYAAAALLTVMEAGHGGS